MDRYLIEVRGLCRSYGEVCVVDGIDFAVAEGGPASHGNRSRRASSRSPPASCTPPLLFLDEPTTGIDVASARDIRRPLAELNGAGTTIFLITHYIGEAERLCDRIAFIVEGRIVRTDRVEVLIEDAQHLHVVHIAVDARAVSVSRSRRSSSGSRKSSPRR